MTSAHYEGSENPYNRLWTGRPMDHFEIGFESLPEEILSTMGDEIWHIYPNEGNLKSVTKLRNEVMADDDEKFFEYDSAQTFQGVTGMNYIFYRNKEIYESWGETFGGEVKRNISMEKPIWAKNMGL